MHPERTGPQGQTYNEWQKAVLTMAEGAERSIEALVKQPLWDYWSSGYTARAAFKDMQLPKRKGRE